MVIRFAPVTLPSDFGDSEGALVVWDDRLVAVVSRLGDLHGELLGRWFVEASFVEAKLPVGTAFLTLDEVEAAMRGDAPAYR